jgi:very-short-patch-repair endonuclease
VFGVRTRCDIDLAIAALAADQCGVVSRRQLLDLGLSPAAVGRRLRSRRLIALHPGVYAVGHARLRPAGFRLAAVLAAGPGTVLCDLSAGEHWGVRPWHGASHTVAVAGTGGRRQRASGKLRVHRRPGLREDETTITDGVPVTTVARTLFDLASIVRAHELRRAVERAEQLELFDLRAVQRVLEHHGGEPGAPALRLLLDDFRDHGVTLTRSDVEALFLQLCVDHRLPRPVVNAYSRGWRELDFRWEAYRLIVEADGWSTHRSRRAFEDDRERDRRLALEGFRVVRITHRQLRDDAPSIARDLRRLLSAAVDGAS